LVLVSLDGILDDDTEKSILITSERGYRGKREIRAFLGALLDAMPQAEWALTASAFGDNTLDIERSAKSPAHTISGGVDTAVFADAMIAIQTAHCPLIRARLNAL